MAKKLYQLEVRGKTKTWCFEVEGEPEWVEDWRNDGLIVNTIRNIIPAKIFMLGNWQRRLWIFLQDILNFNNPFKK